MNCYVFRNPQSTRIDTLIHEDTIVANESGDTTNDYLVHFIGERPAVKLAVPDTTFLILPNDVRRT